MTLELHTLLLIFTAHFIGDFVLQSDTMAIGKSTSNYRLTQHLVVYTAFIAVATLSPVWALVNGIAHWITDYFTSRWTSRAWKAGHRHDFFVIIGLDQLIHAATLMATAVWLW